MVGSIVGAAISVHRHAGLRRLTRACLLAAGLLALALALGAPAARGAAMPSLVHNPLTDPKTGRPLSCPDPSVIREPHRQYSLYMVCTSDFARNAYPIWGSNDGVRWTKLGSVFPHGQGPSWAIPAGKAHGRYWAPDLHRFDGHWVLYFAAQMTTTTARALTPAPQGDFAIGVATTTDLRSGHWTTALLHASGQFNALRGEKGNRELTGGVIDPNEFENPVTGQRYLVWAKQSNEIFLGELSPDGLTLAPGVKRILVPSTPWECANLRGTCTIEGPVGYWYDNVAYIIYSASSTWSGSYAVGVAASTAPLSIPFTKDPDPILTSSGDLLGPGGTSEPVTAPDGSPIIYFHSLVGGPDTAHVSSQRFLTVGRFHYASAAAASLGTIASGASVGISWPQISSGKPKNYTTLVRRHH
jgi:GH43 family beta-xylosidase